MGGLQGLGAASSLGGPPHQEDDADPYYLEYEVQSGPERMLVKESLRVRYGAVRQFLANPQTRTSEWYNDALSKWYESKGWQDQQRIMGFSPDDLVDICTDVAYWSNYDLRLSYAREMEREAELAPFSVFGEVRRSVPLMADEAGKARVRLTNWEPHSYNLRKNFGGEGKAWTTFMEDVKITPEARGFTLAGGASDALLDTVNLKVQRKGGKGLVVETRGGMDEGQFTKDTFPTSLGGTLDLGELGIDHLQFSINFVLNKRCINKQHGKGKGKGGKGGRKREQSEFADEFAHEREFKDVWADLFRAMADPDLGFVFFVCKQGQGRSMTGLAGALAGICRLCKDNGRILDHIRALRPLAILHLSMDESMGNCGVGDLRHSRHFTPAQMLQHGRDFIDAAARGAGFTTALNLPPVASEAEVIEQLEAICMQEHKKQQQSETPQSSRTEREEELRREEELQRNRAGLRRVHLQLEAEIRPIPARAPRGSVALCIGKARPAEDVDSGVMDRRLVRATPKVSAWRRKPRELSLGASAGGQQKTREPSLGASASGEQEMSEPSVGAPAGGQQKRREPSESPAPTTPKHPTPGPKAEEAGEKKRAKVIEISLTSPSSSLGAVSKASPSLSPLPRMKKEEQQEASEAEEASATEEATPEKAAASNSSHSDGDNTSIKEESDDENAPGREWRVAPGPLLHAVNDVSASDVPSVDWVSLHEIVEPDLVSPAPGGGVPAWHRRLDLLWPQGELLPNGKRGPDNHTALHGLANKPKEPPWGWDGTPPDCYRATSAVLLEVLRVAVADGTINLTNDKGKTPLHLAIANGHSRFVNLLSQAHAERASRHRGVDWDLPDLVKQSPFGLFLAAHRAKTGDWEFRSPFQEAGRRPTEQHKEMRNTIIQQLRALYPEKAVADSIRSQYLNNQALKLKVKHAQSVLGARSREEFRALDKRHLEERVKAGEAAEPAEERAGDASASAGSSLGAGVRRPSRRSNRRRQWQQGVWDWQGRDHEESTQYPGWRRFWDYTEECYWYTTPDGDWTWWGPETRRR